MAGKEFPSKTLAQRPRNGFCSSVSADPLGFFVPL
jgi:hypothetical protein